MLNNEGLTSHGTQKNLIGYCYDISNLNDCRTDNIFLNAVIDSNLELARRNNSNGLNIGKGAKGFSIVVTGYKHPKEQTKVQSKHQKPSVARMQTQWSARNENAETKDATETTTKRYFLNGEYYHMLDGMLTKLPGYRRNWFDISSKKKEEKVDKNVEPSMVGLDDNIELEDDTSHHRSVKNNREGNAGTSENKGDSKGCSKEEFMCHVSSSNLKGNSHLDRCIWKRLRCDFHQNCGFIHNNDEINCPKNGVSGMGRGGNGGHGGINGNSINPWSISTMSLLIIIYLAIVLILVLVTMLLLRWHRALRTPLDVLSERYKIFF